MSLKSSNSTLSGDANVLLKIYKKNSPQQIHFILLFWVTFTENIVLSCFGKLQGFEKWNIHDSFFFFYYRFIVRLQYSATDRVKEFRKYLYWLMRYCFGCFWVICWQWKEYRGISASCLKSSYRTHTHHPFK